MNDTKIYPHTLEYAKESGELEVYWGSAEVNRECAAAIDKAISASNYEQYHYNLSDALAAVTKKFSLDRVAWVVADVIQASEGDGRYSRANKEWARDCGVPRDKARNFTLQSHATILDGFADVVRKERIYQLAQTVGAYEKSHHMAERNRLTWYQSDFDTFVPNLGVTERRLAERSAEIAEKQSLLAELRAAKKAEINLLAAAEMSAEQNYNQIDGLINNEPPRTIVKGYIVLDSEIIGHKEVVLAEKATAVQPFVTWIRNISNDEQTGQENFYWGHYFKEEAPARQDFTERVTQEREDAVVAPPSVRSQLKSHVQQPDKQSTDQDNKKTTPAR